MVRIWRSLEEVPADLGRTVVTIGNFDGVHRGHQHVIARAHEVAESLSLDHVVAVTFDPHPIAVLRPEHAPPTLTTMDVRVELLEQAGADDVLVIPFDRDVAGWSPEPSPQLTVAVWVSAVPASVKLAARLTVAPSLAFWSAPASVTGLTLVTPIVAVSVSEPVSSSVTTSVTT